MVACMYACIQYFHYSIIQGEVVCVCMHESMHACVCIYVCVHACACVYCKSMLVHVNVSQS